MEVHVRSIVIALVMLLSASSIADNTREPITWPVSENHLLHITTCTLSTYALGHLLERNTEMGKTERILTSILIVTALGTVKEVFIDDFVSNGDLQANYVGSFIGGFALAIDF